MYGRALCGCQVYLMKNLNAHIANTYTFLLTRLQLITVKCHFIWLLARSLSVSLVQCVPFFVSPALHSFYKRMYIRNVCLRCAVVHISSYIYFYPCHALCAALLHVSTSHHPLPFSALCAGCVYVYFSMSCILKTQNKYLLF